MTTDTDAKESEAQVAITINDAFWLKSGGILSRSYNASLPPQIIESLKECIEEEEYALADILEDIQTWEDSIIVDALITNVPDLTESHESQKKLCACLRIMFGLDEEKPLQPKNVDWSFDKTGIDDARKYINKQCNDVIHEEQDRSLLKIIAVGRKNRINLLPLLYDIYSKSRIIKNMANNSNSNSNPDAITPQRFVDSTPYFTHTVKTKNPNIYQDIGIALKLFEHRFAPALLIINRAKVINDEYEVFVKYTCMMSTIINNIMQQSKCLPLQVEFVIIPRDMTTPDIYDMPNATDDTGSSSDDSEADEDEEDENQSHDHHHTGADNKAAILDFASLEQSIREQMANNFFIGQIDPSALAVNTRNIQDTVQQYIGGNNQHYKRIAVIIDRRLNANTSTNDSGSDADANIDPDPDAETTIDADRLYVYPLPDITHDFCVENLIFTAANSVIPKPSSSSSSNTAQASPRSNNNNNDTKTRRQLSGIGKVSSKFIGGKFDFNGMFLISFQIMQEHLIRLHWFFDGGGVRFWPGLMSNLWPLCFNNPESIDRTVFNEAYMLDNFRLDVTDVQFNGWYDTLVEKKSK